MKNTLKKFSLQSIYTRVFIILFVFSTFYVLPIILFNTWFNDDLGITLYGVTGLNGDGRPLGQLLSDFLSGGGIVADIGPLPLLCSILILSYSLVLYAKENIPFSEHHTFKLCFVDSSYESLRYVYSVLSDRGMCYDYSLKHSILAVFF